MKENNRCLHPILAATSFMLLFMVLGLIPTNPLHIVILLISIAAGWYFEIVYKRPPQPNEWVEIYFPPGADFYLVISHRNGNVTARKVQS